MSLAEDIETQPYDEGQENKIFLKLSKIGVWYDKAGRKHLVSEMTTAHIQNCLVICKREDWRTVYIPVFEAELAARKQILKEANENYGKPRTAD